MTIVAAQPGIAKDAPSSGGGAAVRLAGLSKRIGERQVLDRLDLTVRSGEFVALLGANGAGKSTLLKLIATLAPATAGTIELFGEPVRGQSARLRARIGMIGHQLMLYRDLSAVENLVFFGRLYGVPDVQARAMELLEFVGLADRAGDTVRTLSRGMAQRIAIARALMHGPDLLLTDEPFTGLDVISARQLEQCLVDLHADGRTILLATHDLAQGLRLAQRMVVLRRGRIALDEPTSKLDDMIVAGAMGAGA
ncbi:MAG: ABC transporter ATP-binding protein [Phycisphaerales bacterium JB039]